MELLEEIFFNARQIADAGERQRYVGQACGTDHALRQQVEQMLRDAQDAEEFFGPKGTVVVSPSTTVIEGPGSFIGRYKLLQKIGEGGMGVVYMAEQREPVVRKVALKIIKLGMDTRQVVARFEAERQALALMDHPNIAKVLEAGATETGRPYFVMELVRGIKITDYCDENHLSTEGRLDLFIKICGAVQHAHQKGIIHRDLKPSNILVADHDGVPVPKIIDFGIAKATTGQPLTDKTLFTEFEQFIGTPAYMSPEQAKLSGLDIDTRTDIYSLGVLLYELLTGQTPFDPQRLLATGLEEMRRIIREQEPARPSTVLSTMLDAKLSTAAKNRRTEPPTLVTQIRGDLDWIVMKCLEKERSRRYETANGLAMDIQRHLRDEPVVARPPSRLYEFQKTVRRHKFGFAAATMLILVLGVGALVSTWEAVRAIHAEHDQIRLRRQEEVARARAEAGEKKAQTEAARGAQVARFMRAMLEGVGPGVARGDDTRLLRSILDQTAQRLNELKEQPEVEADLRSTLGNVYSELGLYTNAETMLQRSLDLRRSVYGEEHPEVARVLNDLAETYYRNSRLHEARGMHREALAMRKKLFSGDHKDVATSLNNLGEVLRKYRNYVEAESMFRESLAMRRRLFGNEHLDVAASLRNLGLLLWQAKKFPESELVQRESLAIRQKLLGGAHPDVADSMDLLAKALGSQGKAEAAVCFDQSLAMRKKLFGDNHPEIAFSLHNLGEWYRSQGNLAKAEDMFRQALAMRTKVLTSDHYDTFHSLNYLASVLREEHKLAEAEAVYRDAAASQRKTFEHGNRRLPEILLNWAEQLEAEGKWTEAEALTLEAVPLYTETAATGNIAILNQLAWVLATSAYPKVRDGHAAAGFAERAVAGTHRKEPLFLDTLAAAYAEEEQFTNAARTEKEALALITNEGDRAAYTARLKLYEANTPYRDHSLLAKRTVALLKAGNFAEAELPARECLALREVEIPGDWLTFNARSMLGGSLLGQKKYSEAESLLLSGYEGLSQRQDKIPATGKAHLSKAIQRLVQLYEETNRPEQAAEWKRKLAEQARPEK